VRLLGLVKDFLGGETFFKRGKRPFFFQGKTQMCHTTRRKTDEVKKNGEKGIIPRAAEEEEASASQCFFLFCFLFCCCYHHPRRLC
jgi:hypothetical protein